MRLGDMQNDTPLRSQVIFATVLKALQLTATVPRARRHCCLHNTRGSIFYTKLTYSLEAKEAGHLNSEPDGYKDYSAK